jgi:hypothetical protein
METIGLLSLAVRFVVAWIYGTKKHWKIADIF